MVPAAPHGPAAAPQGAGAPVNWQMGTDFQSVPAGLTEKEQYGKKAHQEGDAGRHHRGTGGKDAGHRPDAGGGSGPLPDPGGGRETPDRFREHAKRAEELPLSPDRDAPEIHPDREGDGRRRRAGGGGKDPPVRRPPLRRPELHPPGHAVRPGEIQGPLLHRQAGEDDRRGDRLRPSPLHDLLLHLRRAEARSTPPGWTSS